jgi:hypothetical protein
MAQARGPHQIRFRAQTSQPTLPMVRAASANRMSRTHDESTSDSVAQLLMRTITQHHPQTPRPQPQPPGKGSDDPASLSEQNQEDLH